MNERFCIIIENFCISLGLFVQSVAHPTKLSTSLIKHRKERNNEFDSYIIIIENFNELTHEIITLIKNIIISLNNLFVYKSLLKLTDFLENLRIFLLFLLDENVFHKLNEYKIELNNKYDKDIKLANKIGKIKYIIFRLFDLSIGITAIFIPQFAMVKDVVVTMEDKTDEILDNKVKNINKYDINLDVVIKKLLDIQLRSQIILSINIDIIHECLNIKDAYDLIVIIENLHVEYIEMQQMSIYLKSEIDSYKKKKKPIFNFNIISKILKS